jgi:hypothetical protein
VLRAPGKLCRHPGDHKCDSMRGRQCTVMLFVYECCDLRQTYPRPHLSVAARMCVMTCMQGLAGTALPTTKKFREMQDELEYKKMQLENTQVRGGGEREQGAAGLALGRTHWSYCCCTSMYCASQGAALGGGAFHVRGHTALLTLHMLELCRLSCSTARSWHLRQLHLW